MIKCSVCQTENDSFATVCTNCKSFLQNRVPNLDLFETAWGIIESPRSTYHKITLAEHKNYSLVLFSFFGVSLAFTGFFYYRLGDRFDSLLELIFWALGIGILVGMGCSLVLTTVYHIGAKLVGGKTNFRSSLGVLSYSLIPIVVSLVVIVPIELLTFGMYLFTWNPHPYTIKPLSYVVLIGADTAVSVWSIVLAVVGTAISHQVSWFRASAVVLATVLMLGISFFLVPRSLV